MKQDSSARCRCMFRQGMIGGWVRKREFRERCLRVESYSVMVRNVPPLCVTIEPKSEGSFKILTTERFVIAQPGGIADSSQQRQTLLTHTQTSVIYAVPQSRVESFSSSTSSGFVAAVKTADLY